MPSQSVISYSLESCPENLVCVQVYVIHVLIWIHAVIFKGVLSCMYGAKLLKYLGKNSNSLPTETFLNQ